MPYLCHLIGVGIREIMSPGGRRAFRITVRPSTSPGLPYPMPPSASTPESLASPPPEQRGGGLGVVGGQRRGVLGGKRKKIVDTLSFNIVLCTSGTPQEISLSSN